MEANTFFENIFCGPYLVAYFMFFAVKIGFAVKYINDRILFFPTNGREKFQTENSLFFNISSPKFPNNSKDVKNFQKTHVAEFYKPAPFIFYIFISVWNIKN